MSVFDKLNDETKNQLKELIYRNTEEDVEYGVAIYRDGSLGKIIRGDKSEVFVKEGKRHFFHNKRLGIFHTHRHISCRPEHGGTGINLPTDPLKMSEGDICRVIKDNDDIECIGAYIAFDKTYRIRYYLLDKKSEEYTKLNKLKRNFLNIYPILTSEEEHMALDSLIQQITRDTCEINLGYGKTNAVDRNAEKIKQTYPIEWKKKCELYLKMTSSKPK